MITQTCAPSPTSGKAINFQDKDKTRRSGKTDRLSWSVPTHANPGRSQTTLPVPTHNESEMTLNYRPQPNCVWVHNNTKLLRYFALSSIAWNNSHRAPSRDHRRYDVNMLARKSAKLLPDNLAITCMSPSCRTSHITWALCWGNHRIEVTAHIHAWISILCARLC